MPHGTSHQSLGAAGMALEKRGYREEKGGGSGEGIGRPGNYKLDAWSTRRTP